MFFLGCQSRAAVTISFLASMASCRHNLVNSSATKIINGALAARNEAPYQIPILGCTATVISPKQILLAAHCVTEGISSNLIPEVGHGREISYWPIDGTPRVGLDIEKTKIHPQWPDAYPGGDLAIITTSNTIPLPSAEIDFDPVLPGTGLIIYGFGCQFLGGPATIQLRKGQFLVAKVDDFLLVSDNTSPSQSCHGDSGGGAFLIGSDGNKKLVGVAHGLDLDDNGTEIKEGYYSRIDGPGLTPSAKEWISTALLEFP